MHEIETRQVVFTPISDPQAWSAFLTVYAKPQRTPPIAGAVLLERFKESTQVFAGKVRTLIGEMIASRVDAEARPRVAVPAT